MSDKTVPVTMPEATWGRLASLADNRGVKVAALVAEAIEGLLDGVEPEPVSSSEAVSRFRRERLIALHALGWSDRHLMLALGYQGTGSVRKMRHTLGLRGSGHLDELMDDLEAARAEGFRVARRRKGAA